MAWLNGLLTCDVSKLGVGQAKHGLIVARKGKILTDVVLSAPSDSESLVLDVDAAAATAVREHFEHHLIMEDIEMRLLEGAPSVAFGPGAPGTATLALRGLVDAPGEVALSFASGEPGDPELYDDLRFLAGWPAFGVDYDEAFYPQEAGLEAFSVAFDKGCYLGQEVVFMLQVRGKVKRRLALLELGSAPPPAAETPVTLADGKEVGSIRTARTVTGGTRAFALLRENAWKPGTELRVGEAVAHVLG